MKRKNMARSALFTSIMSLLLCVSMLVGTTFAWFTDSVVSGSNVITSGNLDIEVQYTLDGENWDDLDGADDLFSIDLWEPGHTEVVALKIENKGSLALKYAVNMNIVSEATGTNVFGEEFALSDILTVSTLTQQANQVGDIAVMLAFAGENKVAYETNTTFKSANILKENQNLAVGDAYYMIIKVDMAETVGNEANHKTGTDAPSINFGVNVLATQYTYEDDSFGNDYDAGAEVPAATAAEMVEALAAGKDVTLAADIDLGAEQITIPAGASTTLDLNGHDLSGSFNDAGHYAMFTIANGASLTVNGNGNVVANTCATDSNRFLSIFENAGNLTINGGNYTVNDTTTGQTWIIATIVDNRTSSASSNAVLTINGGTFSVAGNAMNLFRNYPQQGGTATLTINDGTFKSNPNAATTYIWNQEAGNYPGRLNFLGGTYDANVVYEDYNGQSDITIADGVIINAYSGNS